MHFNIFVAAFVVLLLLPFIWQFLTSVKPLNEIAEMPAKWIPSYFHGQFYVNVFTKHPFARYMLNSLIVATSATLLSLLIGASAAYALSRLHFKGRAVLLMVILGVSMFPDHCNIVTTVSDPEKYEPAQYLPGTYPYLYRIFPSNGNLADDQLLLPD